MIRRLLRLTRSLAVAVAAATMALALTSAPAALADDRMAFTGTTLSGAPFNGASLQGKPAVLWFWAPWCPFCNREAPGVSAVAAANPAVTFVGIAARSDVGAMQDFVSKYHLNFTNLNDADGSLWARFNVPWQPAYLAFVVSGTAPSRPAAVARAAAATAAMTAGFLAVFAVFGVLTVSVAATVQSYLPIVTVLVGATLVVIGGWLSTGRQLHLPLPRALTDRAGA